MEELKAIKSGLRLFEVSKENIETMFCLLSAVLHLGNLTFKDNASSFATIDGATAEEALDCAGKLLQLKKEELLSGVRTKVMFIRGEKVTVELNSNQARDASDALAKSLYSKLFDWMVEKLNECLFVDKYTLRNFIGVLDIFGFENFKVSISHLVTLLTIVSLNHSCSSTPWNNSLSISPTRSSKSSSITTSSVWNKKNTRRKRSTGKTSPSKTTKNAST